MSEKKVLSAYQLEEGLALLRSFNVAKVLGEVSPVVSGAATVKGAMARLFLQGEAATWATLVNFLADSGEGGLLRKAVLIARSDAKTLRDYRQNPQSYEDALWALADAPAADITKEAVGFFSDVVPTLLSALPSLKDLGATEKEKPLEAEKKPSTPPGRNSKRKEA